MNGARGAVAWVLRHVGAGRGGAESPTRSCGAWDGHCDPMSGFDAAKVDDAFLAGSSWRANFLCNLRYGDAATLHPRSPRLEFKDGCRIV